MGCLQGWDKHQRAEGDLEKADRTEKKAEKMIAMAQKIDR
jgi:hypothetical protein